MLQIGVISDIHCHVEGASEKQGGYYFASMPDRPIHQNPFSSLRKLISEKELKLEYIVSPGDYAHQIDPIGLKSAWDQLKIISNDVQAKLLGTIGNHDVSSRTPNNDSFKLIKEFDLDFPVYPGENSENSKSDLLNKSYFIYDDPEKDIFFLIINSCFDHWDKVEASKGKIKVDHLNDINKAIDNSEASIKVLLIHHNLIIHETGIQDTEIIEGSEDLIKNIQGIDLVIYGHKHDFRFTQVQVQPKNLNHLGAGSFSCFKTSLKTKVQNAFHIITFSNSKVDDCHNQGCVDTYLYDPISGWEYAKYLTQGFGCTLSINQIESKISDILRGSKEKYEEWEEIKERLPILNFITKDVRDQVILKLIDNSIIKKPGYDSDKNLETLIIS